LPGQKPPKEEGCARGEISDTPRVIPLEFEIRENILILLFS